MHLFVILLIACAIVPLASAADDTESLRIMCAALLNASGANDSSKNATPEPPAVPEAQNFTYSSRYFAALARLEAANKSVQNLQAAGYPSLRAYDTLLVANQWLVGQAALEEEGGDGDYRFVNEKADEIRQIERDAFSVGDDLKALNARMDTMDPAINLSEPRRLASAAQSEFDDNRFEEAQRLVDQAYDKAAKAEADAIRSRTLLESARKNLENFLKENYQTILGAIGTIVVVGAVFQKQIRRFMVNAKIRSLQSERRVLESMMKDLQKQYYDEGKVNEMSFHIKTKKFADMIRNINRQVPLLKEQLKRI